MGGKKNKGNEPSAKTEKKMKEKVVDDKTFGLKNKNKSAKVQQFCKSVQSQIMKGDVKGGLRGQEEAKFQLSKDKKLKESANALLAALFKGAQGMNAKGADAALEQKQINFYKDPRDGTENLPEDTIITCKHFLDAIEDDKYGWRWECPNTVKCIYMHRLPEGFVILSKKERLRQKEEDLKNAQGEKRTLEEQIEEERALLKADDLTPVTKESFLAWKARRAEKKQKDLEEAVKAQEANLKAKKGSGGKHKQLMNGRALFSYKPELFEDDDNAVDEEAYEEEVTEEQKTDEKPGAKDKIKPKAKVVKEENKEEQKTQADSQIDSSLFQANVEDEDVDFD